MVGRPPFETMSLKETYARIKTNQYVIPSRVSKSAARLIQKFLSNNPLSRPCLETVCETDEFFVKGFVPSSLPPSCCMVPPRFTALPNESCEKTGDVKTNHDKVDHILTKLHLSDNYERASSVEKEMRVTNSFQSQGKHYICQLSMKV